MADKKPKKLADLREQKQDLQSQDVSGLTNAAFAKRIKEEKQINDLIDQRVKKNKAVIKDAEEYLDTLESIGGQVGKNSKLYQEFEKKQGDVKGQLSGIVGILSKTNTLTKEQVDDAEEAAAAYKKGTLNIQSAFTALVKNKDANIDIEKVVESQIKSQKAFANSIKDTTGDAAELKAKFEENVDTLEKMKGALKSAAKDMKAMNKAGEMLSHTPLGGIINQGLGVTKSLGITKQGNLGDVTSSMVAKRGAGAAAGGGGGLMSGIGTIARFAGPVAVVGGALYGIFKWYDGGGLEKLAAGVKMIGGDLQMSAEAIEHEAEALEHTEEFRKINAKYNYIKPLEERQTRQKEYFDWEKSNQVSMIEYENSLVKDELSYQIGLKKDAINFGFQQAMQTMEAEGARRKSLFLAGMNQYKKSLSVSERALNAIGSSTDAVLESIKDVGLALGVSLSEQIKMATSAAGLAKLYGSSGEDVLKMSKNFRLMDKSSSKVALNNVAGLSAFAKMNDMSPAQLFKQMADATEEVMKYSNMTTSQYASQAVLLSNMNTSMKDMATASGTMVLNYKDSIKSEMSLSAMLGKNVNLSEVRARLMSGDMAGGATALKSALGGMDIGSMNAFQKQALSQSTGMGIEQLMELTQSKGGGVKGTLAEKAGLKTGEDIAKGALKMDVSLAAQRLGMEQAQRKQMMKFEQRERLIMLQLEQAQKLKMLEVEAYWRVKWTKEYEMKFEKEGAAAKHLEEMGSGIMMGGGANLMDQAFAGLDKGSAGYAQASSLNNSISSMIQGGQIQGNDMRLSEYYMAQFELAETYKKQPEILAAKLTEAYNKIFAEEAAAQKEYDEKQKRAQLTAFYNEKNSLSAALEIMQIREVNKKRLLGKEEQQRLSELYKGIGTDLKATIDHFMVVRDPTKTMEEFTERLKFVTGEIDKNKPEPGYYVQRPKGAVYPGEPGYGIRIGSTDPFSNPFGLGPLPGYNGPAGTGGTGGTGGGAPPPGPAVKVPNNYIVDTASMVTAINSMASALGGNLNSMLQQDITLRGEVIKLNTSATALNILQTKGYTELLRRADATNQLLDTLIGATADAAAKPIQISGKRINDVMTTVKTRTYAMSGA